MNEKLAEDLPVTTEVMSIDKAKEMGAIALFGEKYGSEVRVVTIGDGFDRELCGGTHVPTTGHIGRVTVLGEGSVASGVRRIEALVGTGAYEFQAKEHALVSQLSQLVGGRVDELPERIESLLAKLRESEKKLEKIQAEQAKRRGGDLAASAERIGAVDLVAAAVDGVPTKELRGLVQDVVARLGSERGAVVALASAEGGKAAFVVATNERARELTLDAGALLRAGLAHVDGRGGGKADIAQGGGTKPEGIAAGARSDPFGDRVAVSLRRGIRIGVDVGTVRVGVSRCDPDGILTMPVVTLTRAPDSVGFRQARGHRRAARGH